VRSISYRDAAQAAQAVQAFLCGHIAASGTDLDTHLLAAFTPPDHLGRDGSRRDPVGETPECATVRA
jgi:hypothetical protein